MALKSSISGREYDKFATDVSGNAAVRMMAVAGADGEGSTVAASSSATIQTTQTVMIDKTDVAGAPGAWFVQNGATTPALTVMMYSAYSPSASAYASGSSEWDQVGSNITVSASGGSKHIPFNNTYRYVALVATTAASSGSATGWLYATN
jgi:hypothetical protein